MGAPLGASQLDPERCLILCPVTAPHCTSLPRLLHHSFLASGGAGSLNHLAKAFGFASTSYLELSASPLAVATLASVHVCRKRWNRLRTKPTNKAQRLGEIPPAAPWKRDSSRAMLGSSSVRLRRSRRQEWELVSSGRSRTGQIRRPIPAVLATTNFHSFAEENCSALSLPTARPFWTISANM